MSWPWTAQSYSYVPGTVNVTAYVPLPVIVALLAKLAEPRHWTLCGREPVQVQVTVPPTGTVSTAAFVLPLWPLTKSIPAPTARGPTRPPAPPPPHPSAP